MQAGMGNSTALDIVYSDPGGVGYHPVLYMVQLAARLLDGQLRILNGSRTSFVDKLLGMTLERRRTGERKCLLICASPADMQALLALDAWRTAYSRIVVWVFDSFWVEHIPRFARTKRHFDHLFVTEPEDIDAWKAICGTDVTCLPWGSDVLRFGSDNPNRSIDVLRVGRQPPEWNDDTVTASALLQRGASFQGRPPCFDDATENECALTRTFADTKFTLSFSNRVSPSVQTHPYREYFTGRWTDAVAAGATVAGVPPKTENTKALFWPGALLALETQEFDAGIAAITRALKSWTPAHSAENHRNALRQLDWRWRFRVLADALGVHSELLDRELIAVEQRLGRST